MGCGVSRNSPDVVPLLGAPHEKPPNILVDVNGEKDASTPSGSNALVVPPAVDMQRRRSQSAVRLAEISTERGKQESRENDSPENMLLGEFFMFSDFQVEVPSSSNRGGRRMSINASKSGSGLGKPMRKKAVQKSDGEMKFVWGDFTIPLDSLDDSRREDEVSQTAEVEASIPSVKLERNISNYEQYALPGHSARIKCVALAPNERFYVSCSNEEAVIGMHDIYTGREVLTFFGHDDTIISACFSMDSKYLATTSRDNAMILWDAVIGQQISVFDHEKVVICCCFSRDGKYLVSGCQDKVCRKWAIRKRKEVLAYSEHEGIIVAVSYSPDGEFICSAAADRTLRVWSATTGATSRVLRGHKGIVLSCTYSGDGKTIVSNDEAVVKIWNVASGDCTCSLDVSTVEHPFPRPPSTKKLAWTLCTYAPGEFGRHIVAVCNDRVVHVIDPKSGEEVVNFYSRAPVYCLSSGQTSRLLFGDSFGNIYIVRLV